MVTLIAVLFWVAVISFVSATRYGGDLRALLLIGEARYHPAALDAVPRVGPIGYDGQYYATLATDPFLRKLDTPAAIDAPAFRAERILVPLAAWALAAGNPHAAILAYQLLCWVLGLAAIYVVARWLADEGRSPWPALLLVPTAGLVASMMRSTLDAAATFLILAVLWAHARRRETLALALAVAAVLTREMSYLVALAVAFDHLRHRRFPRSAAFAAVPLVPFLAWQLYLQSVLGPSSPLTNVGFTYPFAWFGEKLPLVFRATGISWPELFGMTAVAATAIAFVLLLARPRGWTPVVLAFLAFAGLGLALDYNIYVETWGYARILVAVPFLATLVAGEQPLPWLRWSLRAITISYLLAGLAMIGAELSAAMPGRSKPAAARGVATGANVVQRPEPGGPRPWQPLGRRRALYVVPVANSLGRARTIWQTALELTNLAPVENRVLVDFLPEGRGPAAFRHTIVSLRPSESRSWDNAVYELFGISGAGAFRLLPLAGPVALESLTANVVPGRARLPLLPALSGDQAIRAGERATFRGLAHDPSAGATVRTNVGLLNLSDRIIRVHIEPRDRPDHPLGEIRRTIAPLGFVQVSDIFGRVKAGVVEHGSALIETSTPGGAFLAYASVVRGPNAQAVYEFAQRSLRPPADGQTTPTPHP